MQENFIRHGDTESNHICMDEILGRWVCVSMLCIAGYAQQVMHTDTTVVSMACSTNQCADTTKYCCTASLAAIHRDHISGYEWIFALCQLKILLLLTILQVDKCNHIWNYVQLTVRRVTTER